ncbi:hypothetical protein [Halalkalibacter sp. APA_J-10(15)]|uniref:UPF0738 family protein n=1 Tax=unclassified Halalkalibacter TaxID=2893063 RepID=UPI001FF415FF|nr:hypothetical protein [Halalkalibacter sp. APA_J-10(15)]MCK0472610.1 hypothetical protein [Halalkalibacter sp. APA_J-10(15)]
MKKIYVTKLEVAETTVATIDEPLDVSVAQELKPGERMLVDSDQLELIYILENEEGFFYVSFSEPIWESLKLMKEQSKRCIVQLNDQVELELNNLFEELDYLLSNIDGNGNYGEELEDAVKQVFY